MPTSQPSRSEVVLLCNSPGRNNRRWQAEASLNQITPQDIVHREKRKPALLRALETWMDCINRKEASRKDHRWRKLPSQ